MTRVPVLLSQSGAAEEQIEAALGRLIKLFAQQTARELAASASDAKEPTDALQEVLED